MAKIVVTDSDFEVSDIEQKMIEEAGIEFARFQDRSASGIIANCADADGIITSYGQLTAEVFAALPQLQVVSRTGVGVDTVDLPAASEHGVAVCNVPGYATEVVSDHAIAMAMALLRRLPEINADVHNGIWDYARHRPLGQVYGRTFGVVGMGDIGRAVARKASGLGFKVICWSHSLVPGRRTPEGYEIVSYDDLLKHSDVVSFHTALVPATHHLLNADNIKLLKKDCIVINTSRGAVIDTTAIAAALKADAIWGAGIDVFEEEPIATDDPLMSAPHALLTPHAAYWSEESGVELRTRSAQNAIDVVLGREPHDCLNKQVFGANGKLKKLTH
jgi:D-3-phosphoglycerate dehydrogenase